MKIEASKAFVDTFKQILTQDQFIGKVEICRFLLENAFWIAEKINKADDGELTGLLLALLRAWRPGVDKRFEAEEYERQHIALALQNIVKIYGTKTMLLFYEPLYKEFLMQELVDQKPAEKSQENSKVQLAESYHEFLLNAACKERPENELKRGNAEMQAQ